MGFKLFSKSSQNRWTREKKHLHIHSPSPVRVVPMLMHTHTQTRTHVDPGRLLTTQPVPTQVLNLSEHTSHDPRRQFSKKRMTNIKIDVQNVVAADGQQQRAAPRRHVTNRGRADSVLSHSFSFTLRQNRRKYVIMMFPGRDDRNK